MPTTILDGETYEQARHRRFTEEAKVIEKMQQDKIIRMAKESGAVERYFGNQLHGIAFHKKEWLERFAALVAAHERETTGKVSLKYMNQQVLAEREACAKVCEEKRIQMNYSEAPYTQCAAAIRARSEK